MVITSGGRSVRVETEADVLAVVRFWGTGGGVLPPHRRLARTVWRFILG